MGKSRRIACTACACPPLTSAPNSRGSTHHKTPSEVSPTSHDGEIVTSFGGRHFTILRAKLVLHRMMERSLHPLVDGILRFHPTMQLTLNVELIIRSLPALYLTSKAAERRVFSSLP